jgi:phosphoglycolate phosphatase
VEIGMKKTRLTAKGIILDMDGTIVDSRRVYLEAVKTAFATTGLKMGDISIVTEIPKRIELSLPIDDLLDGVDADRFLKTYLRAYYQATAEKAVPMPNISETLHKLSQMAKLALITMRHVPREEVIKELDKFGLTKYFQEVTTALDTRYPKPSPQAFIQCAEKLNVETGECLVVGDSVADVRAGKNAGAKTVAVLSGIFSRAELEEEKPDLILESVSKLPEFLK